MPMQNAKYLCSGWYNSESEYRHYALSVPFYTHFTSPIRRYADVIVHRLLAVCIGADATYPELVDKKQTQKIAENINYRHRMAQYASRASVNLYTHIYFKDKRRDETGYVLFIRQNALQILIPKYGLEGTLFLRSKDSSDCEWSFDEEEPSQTCGEVKITLFMKVKVQVFLDSSDIQHEKLALRLVNPVIPGFSVSETREEEGKRPSSDELNSSNKKRKI